MKYILIAAVVIVIAFLAVLSFIPLGIEPLTELFIENHTKLPVNIFLNKSYNFSFSVHNLEYQDVLYNYTVNAYDVNNTLIKEIGKGSFTLANNESKTTLVNYKFDDSFERAKIEVVINKNLIGTPDFKRKLWWPDPNYPTSIDVHFWVGEIMPTKIIITRE